MNKFLLPIFLLMALRPLSARVSMDVQPREFSVDNHATLTLTIQGGVSGSPQLNLPSGLAVTATSRNEVIVQSRRETTFRYTLSATAPGDYLVGPYSLQLDGRTYALEGIPVTVLPAKIVQSTGDLFMELEVSGSRALVQQPVQVTITFYSVNQIENIELLEPLGAGLETGEWQQQPARDQVLDGRRFYARRYVAQVTPMSQGVYNLAPVFLVNVLEPEEEMSRGPIGMFTRRMNRRSVRLQPPEQSIEARHPPAENRPASFTGAVGQFSLSASASPLRLRVGEPITLRIQLSGRGNIRSLLPPSLEETDDFRVFAARLVEEDIARDGQSGRKTLEQVLIPKHAEVDRIPSLVFSYFNPETWEYATRITSDISLQVAPSDVAQAAGFAGGAGSLRLNLGPQILGQDLVYLKANPGRLRPFSGPSLADLAVWSALPAAFWALATLLLKRRETLRNDPALARQLQAPQRLRKHLAAVKSAGPEQLHERIWTALQEYLGGRFRLPPGGLDAESIGGLLANRLPPERIEALRQWLLRCERARFSGGGRFENPEETVRAFETFILALDREGT